MDYVNTDKLVMVLNSNSGEENWMMPQEGREGSLKQLVDTLQHALRSVPTEYRESARALIETTDGETVTMSAWYYRPETKAERARRVR